MRYDEVYATGVACWLPPAQPVPEETLAETGIESVAISELAAPPDMAAQAALLAIERAETDPAKIALVAYADCSYPGHDGWIAAPYVQRLAVGYHNPTLAVDVRQLGNGGMAGLELAAAYLHGTGRAAALVVGADRFRLPAYDRWRGEPGSVLGDGASACVLTRAGGFARLRSVVSWTDPELEWSLRGDKLFADAPLEGGQPVDMRVHREAFVARFGDDNWRRLTAAGRRSCLELALSEAGVPLEEIGWFVLPNLGHKRLAAEYLEPFGIDLARTTWPGWGRRVGHLGVADQFAGLDFLRRSGRLRPGNSCLLMGAGGDVVWSCAVLEITTAILDQRS